MELLNNIVVHPYLGILIHIRCDYPIRNSIRYRKKKSRHGKFQKYKWVTVKRIVGWDNLLPDGEIISMGDTKLMMNPRTWEFFKRKIQENERGPF